PRCARRADFGGSTKQKSLVWSDYAAMGRLPAACQGEIVATGPAEAIMERVLTGLAGGAVCGLLAGYLLVGLLRSLPAHSLAVLGVPFAHPLVGPGPVEGVRVPPVVLMPGGHHLRDELLPRRPRPALEVAPAERPAQQFRLVQPRGVRRRQAGSPP